MNNFQTLESQIFKQLTGRISVKLYISDAEPAIISVWKDDDGCFIQPAFCKERSMPAQLFEELSSHIVDERFFNTDPYTIHSELTYDEFMNRYFNNLPGYEHPKYRAPETLATMKRDFSRFK